MLAVLYYLNLETVTKGYNKLAIKTNCPKCGDQSLLQTNLQQKFDKVKQNLNIQIPNKKEIENLSLYRNILSCINVNLGEIKKFGQKNGKMLSYDQTS